MKNIQTMPSKFITLFLFVLTVSLSVNANNFTLKLNRADSLFNAKQYTQSFDLYNSLFVNNLYTPAMLLKMAFIQEGLGHLSLSLYYLTAYANSTNDSEGLEKIHELATKNNLEGYADPYSSEKVFSFYQKHNVQVTSFLLALSLLLISLLYYQKGRQKQLLALALLLTLVLGIAFWQVNFSGSKPSAIIANANTYLMEGPSAGAPVMAIVGEGHKLSIEDHYDVWCQVKWNGKPAFIKHSGLLPININ
jgi:hypothetical protein